MLRLVIFSNFFVNNFEEFGIKKVICACCYNKKESGKGYYYEHTGSKINFNNIKYFKGNGDFRSLESIELLRQCDVVVTNPPFHCFENILHSW